MTGVQTCALPILFPFVMSAAEAGAPVAAHGVDLVYKYDAGGIALGLVKQILQMLK